jgi:hypothetical protein
MSICGISPNLDGRMTGVVFLGVFRIVAQSPKSKTTSGGKVSMVIVS